MYQNDTDSCEVEQIQRAVELIRFDARLQLLEPDTKLSGERLLALYPGQL